MLCLLLLSSGVSALEWSAGRLLAFADETCQAWSQTSAPAAGYAHEAVTVTDLRFGEAVVGRRYRVPVDDNALVELDVVERGGSAVRFVASLFSKFGDPLVLISLAADCSLQAVRELHYNKQGQALKILSLDSELQPVGEPDWLNPTLEFEPREARQPLKHHGDNGVLRVAMVDSGVNYRLPEINQAETGKTEAKSKTP